MKDKPNSYSDISSLYEQRKKVRDQDIWLYNEVEAAIQGRLSSDYDKLFSESDIRLQLRTLRAADDSLTKFLSEIPILPHADIRGKRESESARNKAELAEKIVYGYHNGSALRGGVEFDGITFQLARHQVRFGDGCVLIHPDHKRKLVYLEVKDPRCHYPPNGWHPWSQAPLDGTLLVYEMTLGEVKRRFAYDSYGDTIPDVMGRLSKAFPSSNGWNNKKGEEDTQVVKVGVYRSREYWCIVAIGNTDVVLAESETGDRNHPGVCGVMSFKQYASEPLFLGQIGIEAYLEKVANQQVQNTERINKATTIGPPLLRDELVIGGYNEVNMALMQGRSFQPYRMAPDSPTNLTQVMGQLLSFAQMFNYNPDSNMGMGDANSGKAINALQAGPRSLVTNILFSPYKPAFPRVYDDCMDMELNLWPNQRKTAVGKNGHEVDYTPSSALEGFKGHIKIEEARVGGYNAFLEAVQKRDAGMLDLRSTLEKDPDVRNVEQTLRRIESESVEKFTQAAFEALGGQDPLLAIKAAAEIKKRIDSGKTKFEAIQAVIEEGMLEPPAPEPEMGMAGGMPPELAAMMGGAEEMPPPSLAAARGF